MESSDITWLAELIGNNTIGLLREIELMSRSQSVSELTPWLWMDMLASGGGMLNNAIYLTFRNGWRYQEAVDAIRAGDGWPRLAEYSG